MPGFRTRLLAVALGATIVAPALAAGAPALRDLGALPASERAQVLTATVSLRLCDADGAEALVRQIHTPGSAQYHRFLTTAQFRERFAPTPAQREQVAARLRGLGLGVADASTSSTLRVSGTAAAFERAFGTTLHRYASATQAFHAPASAAVLPLDIAPLVHAVLGLDDRPALHTNHRSAPAALVDASRTPARAQAAGVTHPIGHWTVGDFASYYDVAPLYAQGIQGQGRTLGIVAFAALTPSDVFAYWKVVGIDVDPQRLRVVDVDGGPGAPSDASGSDETTLDVEQAGGVAPAARIVVYQAPNTDQGFVDVFAAAIDANEAETLSTSWGQWEWLDNGLNSTVTDPHSGHEEGSLRALHLLLLQAALQGQTVIAAAGDAGAYDANDGSARVPPNVTLALSVDSPGADPYIVSAGGTTLAGTQTFDVGGGQPPVVVTIPEERVWGWDYLQPLCDALGQDPFACGILPVGGGGGVSVVFKRPFYQVGLDGFRVSEPGQAIVDERQQPPRTVYTFPADFAGRNVPDVSANADPDTGYMMMYTSDRHGFGTSAFNGGTSFVAPQLNGVAALLVQATHGRIGLLNVPLYEIARHHGYKTRRAPLRAIAQGGNEFWMGSDGYNPAAGLGVLDVASLARAMNAMK